ncbi:MAG: exostosin family protein [bacterium]|nr:exostosin family protein [bacterium]
MNKHNDNLIITVYIGTPLQGIPTVFFLDKILFPEKHIEQNIWNMFQGVEGEAPFNFLKVVSNPKDADFLLLPHNHFSLKRTSPRDADLLLSHLLACAEQYKKKILIFEQADSDEHIDVPHSYIFRYSQYGYKKRENEIITPPYPLHDRSFKLAEYREKTWKEIIPTREKSDKPIVSFCGWADFPSLYRECTYRARVFLAHVKKYIFRDPHAILHLRGLYFRRKAMRSLSNSSRIHTNFLMRKSYAAQKISDDAEREYIESILNAHFVLAPKGNGNASVRFFEALSLGRFPILINTDCELPLKNHIPYDKFVVTVDHTRMEDAELAILDFYNSLSNEEFKKRQKMAREAFELLRPGSFLKIVLSELKQR